MERISKNKYKTNKREKGNKKKLTRKQKILIVCGVIFSIIVLLGVVFGSYVYKSGGNIADAAINIMADVVGDETPITALVLGVSEGIDTPLTDTMMLVGYNPKTQSSFVLSIPRDTYIGTNDNYANGYSKINALYQKNVKETVKAVEKLTGVKIDNYIVVKTSALIEVVDAIGGVDFEVPIDMKYDDKTQNLHIDLKAGMQKIDGAKAEQLLRYRHSNPDKNGKMTTYPASYGSDDFGRMRTQREFLKTTVKQLANWKNVGKLGDVASAVFDNLETDMKLTKMIGYIPSVLKLDVENLRMEQLPGASEKINDLWFYAHDLKKTKTLMTELMTSLGLSESEYNKKYTPISTVSKRIRKPVEETPEEPPENKFIEAPMVNNTVTNTNTNKVNNNKNNTTTNNTNTNTTTEKECEHNWTTKIDVEPGCKRDGSKTLTCTKCNKTKTQKIPAVGHNFVDGTCTRCAEKDPNAGGSSSENENPSGGNSSEETPPTKPETPPVTQDPEPPVQETPPTTVPQENTSTT